MTNPKKETISIEIVRNLPYRANLTFSDPKPEVDGSILTWRLDLKSGETKVLRYGYEELLEPKR